MIRMDLGLYHEYAGLSAQGRRREAGVALRAFIASFNGLSEKQQFTAEFLEQHFGSGIPQRDELRQDVVLPALLDGYARRDPWSLYWLARVGVEPRLVDGKGPLDLLKECLALDWQPQRVRSLLLSELLRGFSYAAHEWPARILGGSDGATLAQCADMLADVHLARELDVQGHHATRLDEFESKVRAYRERLRSFGSRT